MVSVQRDKWTSPNLTDCMESITTLAHHVDLDLSCVVLGPIFVRHLLPLPSIHLALALEKGYFHCHNKLHSEPFLKSTIAGSRDTRVYPWWPQQAEKSYHIKLLWEPPTAATTLNCPCRRVRSAGSGQRRNNRQKEVNVYFRGHVCLTAREEVFKWK